MDCSTHFRRTTKGNYIARFDGVPCTEFVGEFGNWSYFLDGEPAGRWFDSAERAMAMVVAALEEPKAPACLKFFSLAPPVDHDTLKARYRELAVKAHPDRGGKCAAFKKVQSNFESALSLTGGAA